MEKKIPRSVRGEDKTERDLIRTFLTVVYYWRPKLILGIGFVKTNLHSQVYTKMASEDFGSSIFFCYVLGKKENFKSK